MIFIGFDPREASSFAVARHSIKRRLTQPIPVRGLVLDDLRKQGLYRRQTELKPGVDRMILWDTISEAPMATEFAISRFLVPHIAKTGWAVFMDCDVLVRVNPVRLFDQCDPTKAVMCVKHQHEPKFPLKMDGQMQTRYPRKNWSSVMLFNCDHPANKRLTLDEVNTRAGRDLHRFCWLEDDEIGDLPPEWNVLVGHTQAADPKIVHFTDGVPSTPGYENAPYADEWRRELALWAA